MAMVKPKKVSVQDRIRALNLQQKESGRCVSDTPPRQSRASSWSGFQYSSPPRPAAEVAAAARDAASSSSGPPPTQPSPLPPSVDKAQLFKAARVIKKSFNPDADMLRRTQQRASAYSSDSESRRAASQPSSYGHQRLGGGGSSTIEDRSRTQHAANYEEGEKIVLQEGIGAKSSEEEIDASAALEFWRTKGITPRGPLSYREMKRKESKGRSRSDIREHLASSICSANAPSSEPVGAKGRTGSSPAADNSGLVPNSDEAGESNATDHDCNVGVHQLGMTATLDTDVITLETRIPQDETAVVALREEGDDGAKPPSPPDIIRTANTDSEMDQHGVVDAVEDVYNNDCDQHINEQGNDEKEERDIRRQEPDDVFRQEGRHDHAAELLDGDHGHEKHHISEKEDLDAFERDDQNISAHESPDDDMREQEGEALREKEGQHLQDKEQSYNNTAQQDSRDGDYMQHELPNGDYGALSNTETLSPEYQVTPVNMNEDAHVNTAVPVEESQSSDTDNEHSILTEMVPLKMDKEVFRPEELKKPRHVRSLSASSLGGGPYRAYARRSRLRSPRMGVTATSPDHSAEIDGTQSVVSSMSVYSASSQATSLSQSSTQVSSLSSRATRFLKDKKDKRKGATVSAGCSGGSSSAGTSLATSTPGTTSTPEQPSEVFAKDIAQNILGGRASKARIKQRMQTTSALDAAAATSSIHDPNNLGRWDKTDSPFDEPSKGVGTAGPQTIDLKPAIKPKTDPSQDFGDHLRLPQEVENPPEASQSSKVPRSSSSICESSHQHQKEDVRTPRQIDRAASMDDHSSYSELKAKDLFDISGSSKKPGIKMQLATSPQSEINTTLETNMDFSTFPRRKGKSFDQGCQVLEAINPLIESAFNALSPSSANPFFGTESRRTMSTAFCDNAPSDEDIAIEVEYVEQGEERSHAETDSIFSVSTRDIDSV